MWGMLFFSYYFRFVLVNLADVDVFHSHYVPGTAEPDYCAEAQQVEAGACLDMWRCEKARRLWLP